MGGKTAGQIGGSRMADRVWVLTSDEQGKIEKMSFSEKLVDALAVSILLLGFVTGVIAHPMNRSPHETTLTAHSVVAQHNWDARRALLHS